MALSIGSRKYVKLFYLVIIIEAISFIYTIGNACVFFYRANTKYDRFISLEYIVF